MISGKQVLWGTLGWAFAGPIGGILGVIFAGSSDKSYKQVAQSQAGDFMVSLLVLFAKVMKADGKLLKSELDYVKSFLKRNLSRQQSQVFIKMFQEILKQEYSTAEVCKQIQKSMDHPSRLELLHVLFGLSASDGEIHPEEVRVIHTISGYINISNKDYESIKAIFIKDIDSAYKILEIDASASDGQVKKAYRKMAVKYHPDKVAHLGKEIQKTATEKFKAVNDAYTEIKKQRNFR
jgi:DnaJ like chaperone protein|tara:strand:- start:1902 stop:2609 length:708 start_codon:yes stop_codon:yes gene_type:complete